MRLEEEEAAVLEEPVSFGVSLQFDCHTLLVRLRIVSVLAHIIRRQMLLLRSSLPSITRSWWAAGGW